MKIRKVRQYDFQLMEDMDFPVDMPDTQPNGIVGRFIKIVDGRLYISKYYCWDGSSVPLKKWYRWIWDSDKYCKTASLVHDCLCQLIGNGFLPLTFRIQADELYREMCIAGGMGERQANMRFKFLRKFGGKKVVIEGNPVFEV